MINIGLIRQPPSQVFYGSQYGSSINWRFFFGQILVANQGLNPGHSNGSVSPTIGLPGNSLETMKEWIEFFFFFSGKKIFLKSRCINRLVRQHLIIYVTQCHQRCPPPPEQAGVRSLRHEQPVSWLPSLMCLKWTSATEASTWDSHSMSFSPCQEIFKPFLGGLSW